MKRKTKPYKKSHHETACQHEPDMGRMSFSKCGACGSGAAYQRWCQKCGALYCTQCNPPAPNRRKRQRGPQPGVWEIYATPAPLADPVSAAKNEPKPAEKFVDAPLTPKQHARYLRGYAGRRQMTEPMPDEPRQFDALDIMARHARRWCIPLDALPDRDWMGLYEKCKSRAISLTEWAAHPSADAQKAQAVTP